MEVNATAVDQLKDASIADDAKEFLESILGTPML